MYIETGQKYQLKESKRPGFWSLLNYVLLISLRFHLQRHPLHFSFTEAIPHHYHFQRLPHSGHSVRNTLALVEVGKNLRRSIQQSHGDSQVVTARSTSTKKPNCHVLACQQTWTWLYPKPIKCRMKTMCLQNMQMQQCPPVAILVDRFRMLQGQTHILLMVQRSCTFLVWTHTHILYISHYALNGFFGEISIVWTINLVRPQLVNSPATCPFLNSARVQLHHPSLCAWSQCDSLALNHIC